MATPHLSLIIPVYNRPNEVEELLDSLTRQSETNFEVVIVEDGSKETCQHVAEAFKDRLDVSYCYIPNGGPGNARNYGAKQSKGDYLIVLDSDCILPPDYIKSVNKELEETGADAFGGPDKASDSFTDVQKAINYSMTSFFTTGGIRGGKRRWISSTLVVSTWGFGKVHTRHWRAFLPCASAKILISVSACSRTATKYACFPRLGYITSDARTGASFSARFIIPESPVSICTRNIRTRLNWYIYYRQSLL